ncbi:AAA family ATPase [Salmonella enterica]|uniref:AAA family ATPase n=1 Tax=Salmonella enterica TaxID=28901 RepID=UPI003D20481B
MLIYGPNGTGKSSFCEALEYTLLGNVAEAESKRFRNQNEPPRVSWRVFYL